MGSGDEPRGHCKLGRLIGAPDEGDTPFAYENEWRREHTTSVDRLAIAPARGHLALMRELAAIWRAEIYVLYVLLVSRLGNEPGRYESPEPISRGHVAEFLARFE
ncbi:MAG TPA: hypothetical protein VFT98_13660, partial [Myxococcota bacterium]|nr:hypothetical protein [Myxococcota bacterium]